ncbi:MAG TPA: NAD(P)/FAD-dependent oxidoreductase [Patescibacteria group bacterium]|nr:NAD(P)/FAD-dependent oxidoreductase [Patescibacteria group bacterium]
MRSDAITFAIVGGGFLGMTLARRLAAAGRAVTLFEAQPALGGLASAWQLDDVVWDRHYHVTSPADTYLLALLRELDLEHEMRWQVTRTGFYVDGTLLSLSNVAEFLRFPPLGITDKVRLGATILHASQIKDWRPLEEITAVEWLTRWCGRRTVEKIWLPLLRAKLGDNSHKASAAFIWAIVARMYAARRTRAKRELFGFVPGGYARVLEHMGRRLEADGVRVELQRPVSRISSSGDGVQIDLPDGPSHRFDNVVLTAAAPLCTQVVDGLTPSESARLEGVEYQGIICASLLLRRPLAGYYVTNITDGWVPFTAVIEMSALVGTETFGGRSLVYLPRYLPPGHPDFALSDDEIRARFIEAIARMYPHFSHDDVAAFRVSRTRYVFPISTLHYSAHVPPLATSLPGVYLVNSSQIVNGTLNVNETLQLAHRAADHLVHVGGRARELLVS